MSTTRPLFVNPDLRSKGDSAYFYVDKKTGKGGFGYGKMDNPNMEYNPVNDNASRSILIKILALIKNLLCKIFRVKAGLPPASPTKEMQDKKEENGKRKAHSDEDLVTQIIPAPGEAFADGQKMPNMTEKQYAEAVKSALEQGDEEIRTLLKQADDPAHHPLPTAADNFLDDLVERLGFEEVWPEGYEAHDAVNMLVSRAETENLDVDETELSVALYAHIDELQREGRELSPEQNAFMEEMRDTNEVQRLDVSSPMRARPVPGKKY